MAIISYFEKQVMQQSVTKADIAILNSFSDYQQLKQTKMSIIYFIKTPIKNGQALTYNNIY